MSDAPDLDTDRLALRAADTRATALPAPLEGEAAIETWLAAVGAAHEFDAGTRGTVWRWIVYERTDGTPAADGQAGCAPDQAIGLACAACHAHRGSFGFVLRPGHRGRGLGRELAAALVEHLRRQPGIHRVESFAWPDRLAGARVLGQAGLVCEARLGAIDHRIDRDPPLVERLVYASVRGADGVWPPPRAQAPRDCIDTARLQLRRLDARDAQATLDYGLRNQEHLAPWDPPPPPGFHSLGAARERLTRDWVSWEAGASFRYWLFLRGDAHTVIGMANVSGVTGGVFRSANLGYQIDAAYQGLGLMREALAALTTEVFAPPLSLHRIAAAHLPHNARSAAVLARLGFVREGLAPKFLFIADRWHDHVLTALVNPHYGETLEPAAAPAAALAQPPAAPGGAEDDASHERTV